MPEVVIITPELTPGGGGVGDYTLRVLEQWEGGVAPVFPESLASLPSRDGRLLVQYSAYGFDRFGYPRRLLRALREWKQNSGGRLVMMFHEIWSFWSLLNKNWIVQAAHRRDLRKLLPHVDAIFSSTANQAEHLRRLAPGVTVEVLPVGSNVRVIQEQGSGRPTGGAVLFGLQGSRGARVAGVARCTAVAGRGAKDHTPHDCWRRWRGGGAGGFAGAAVRGCEPHKP